MISSRRLVRRLAGAAGLLAIAPLVPAVPVHAADPGTPPVGTMTMSPDTGTAATEFVLAPLGGNPDNPAAAYCPGNSATDGYRWQTYIVPVDVDPATLTYDGDGPHPPAAQADRQPLIYSLTTTGGTPFQNLNTSVNPSGLIDPSGSLMSFGIFPHDVFPDGDYLIGIACSRSGVTETYWTVRITLTAEGSVGYSFAPAAAGAAPAAPAIDEVEPGDGALAVTFALDTDADPPVTRYDATATPAGGGTAVTVSGAGSPLTISGLTNGTTYDVTLTATNLSGTSAASAAVSATPVAVTPPSSSSSTSTSTTSSTSTTPSSSSTSSTTSSTVAGGVVPPVASSTSSTVATSGGALPRTGSSTGTIVLWAIVLLAAGRIAVLLVRRPEIAPPK